MSPPDGAADDDDDDDEPVWPTWAVGTLFRGVRLIHINRVCMSRGRDGKVKADRVRFSSGNHKKELQYKA
jgi:hypothetical protein